jgi:hypothetical protein
MTTLIPASNFQVRKLSGAMHMKTKIGSGHVELTGFGLWDISAQAWVSFDVVDGVQVPTGWKRKSTAVLAIKDGLYQGYKTAKV